MPRNQLGNRGATTVDFKTATDRLLRSITLADIATAAGVEPNTIRRARLDESSPNYRRPPANWREIIMRLARERGGEMSELADELEGGAP